MENSKEWRKKQRILSDEELSIITEFIRENTKKPNKDETAKSEDSDGVKLNMDKKARRPKIENIR